MKQPSDVIIWQRLVAAVRQTPDHRDDSAPFGFSTRVAALAMNQPAPGLSFALDRFSMRALALSGLIMIIGVVSSYSISVLSSGDDETVAQDVVSEIIDLT